jgi:penicillin-binding protein 1A
MTIPPPERWQVKLWRWTKRLLAAGAALAFLGVIVFLLVIRHYEEDLPSISAIKASYRPPQVTRVLARDGTLLAEIFTERRTVISIATLPPRVKLAVLAAEDAGFYEHEGLNYWGMLRALAVNLRSHRTRQGGSTITQQVVKNLLLDPERSFRRKMREVILARRLEQQISKDEILELYLNHIYFGHGRYGIEEAARYYFGKSAKDVSLGEAAMLAGLPAGPERYSPRHDPALAQNRRAFVLGQMLQKGFIDQNQYDAAMSEPLRLAEPVEAQGELVPEVIELVKRTLREVVGEAFTKGGVGYTVTTTIDPRLETAARKAVRDNLDAYDKRYKLLAPFTPPTAASTKKKGRPAEKAFEGTPKFTDHKVLVGAVIGANDAAGTLDVRVGTVIGTVKLADYDRYNPEHLPPSRFAEEGTLLRVSLLAALPAPAPATTAAASRPAASGSATAAPAPPPPPRSPTDETPKVPLRLELGPESALVALDVRSREILALVGSYEAISGGLDRATQAHRQPGSSFKPFVYSYALFSRRFTPATLLETNPKSLPGYRPKNFEDSEGSVPMRLREALAHSVNVAAVHTLSEVGPSNVVLWGAAMGITSKLGADLSLALGSYEVTPMEMATAYSTFASGGVYEAPILITKIVGPDGAEIALAPRPPSRRVMGEPEAFLTTSLLSSVVDHGTGAAAKSLARPVAGKTGTSNDAKDAWFVGYSTDIVCATWTGYDDSRSLGGREQGASSALPAWVSFMKAAHEKRPPTEFPRPLGIVIARIDPATGLRAYEGEVDAMDEMFLAGTEPFETSVPDAGAGGDADGGTLVPGGDMAEELDPAATVPSRIPTEADGGLPQLPRLPEEPPPF